MVTNTFVGVSNAGIKMCRIINMFLFAFICFGDFKSQLFDRCITDAYERVI